ncbi:MAG TPA: hypothetical protein VGG89_12080 [Candidatus Baltobacteraceae bacterium]|jgi:serine protease
MRRWFFLLPLALLAACSSGLHSALPNAPVAGAPMGALGPRLKLSVTHRGRPHYFYNRSLFAAINRAHPDSAPYAGPLLYGGGAVQTVPESYLIFWGWSGSTDATADPDYLAPYMVSFFKAIPASSWLATTTQYSQDLGSLEYITNPAGQYAGATYDPSTVPSTYTEADVYNEAIKFAGTVGYNANVNYIVVTPHGHSISGFNSSSGFCAYHSAVSTTHGQLSFTVFPYIPDAGYYCGAGSVNSHSSNAGILDGVSIVGGHEEAETITDPDAATGWLDSNGQEIGDKCAWYHLQNTSFGGTTLGTSMFPTQPLWSNAAASASGCVQSYGGSSPTPTPSPPPSTNAIANPGFETSHLKPWSTCRSAGKMPLAFTTTQKPHTGSYDAYAGTVANQKEPAGLTAVCQRVTIPAGGRLTVWLRGISDDKRNGVFQFVRLYTSSGGLAKTLFTFNANNKTWFEQTVDLSAYAGRQYYLAFGIQGKKNAHGRVIGLFVDDVTLAP